MGVKAHGSFEVSAGGRSAHSWIAVRAHGTPFALPRSFEYLTRTPGEHHCQGARLMRSRRGATIAMTAAIVMWAGFAGAQNIGATLQGLIVDEQHAVLPGVSVAITNIDTGIA